MNCNDTFNRVMPTILVQKAKVMMAKKRMRKRLKNERVVPVPMMMYDVVLLVTMTTEIDEAQIDQSVAMNEKVTMKKINVKKSPNPSRPYQSVGLMLKYRELYPIWAVTFILLNCQIFCRSKHVHSIRRHMKMKSMKRKRSMKKVDKGKLQFEMLKYYRLSNDKTLF